MACCDGLRDGLVGGCTSHSAGIQKCGHKSLFLSFLPSHLPLPSDLNLVPSLLHVKMSQTVGNWGARESNYQQPLSWASEGRVYDWKPHYTLESAPDDPQLEKELFDTENFISTGINFPRYGSMNVSVKGGPEDFKPVQSVSDDNELNCPLPML